MSKLKEIVKQSSRRAAQLAVRGATDPAGTLFDALTNERDHFASLPAARTSSPRSRKRGAALMSKPLFVLLLGAVLGAGGLYTYQKYAGTPGVNPDLVKLKFKPTAWVEQSLDKYKAALDLRPDQAEALRKSLQTASKDLKDTQERASVEARQSIHLVHAQLMPLLDGRQRASFNVWRKTSEDAAAEDEKAMAMPVAGEEMETAPVAKAVPVPREPVVKDTLPKPPAKYVPKAVPVP